MSNEENGLNAGSSPAKRTIFLNWRTIGWGFHFVNLRIKLNQWLVCGVAALALLLSSCMTHYDITLQNGDIIRARTKPKLNDQGSYVFKDLAGRQVEIKSMRIRQIEPVRAGSEKHSFYSQ
jgi:hypothetical protein